MAFNYTATSGLFTIQNAASVVINSPNSGLFNVNENLSITWTKTDFSENVDLYYTSGTTFSTSNAIATNQSGTSYSWNIPSSLSATSKYIWVRKTGDSTVKDISNSSITFYTVADFSAADTTAFTESVSFDSSGVWRFFKAATDTTTFSTDSVTTAESRWWDQTQLTASDTTTFSTDSVTTAESRWWDLITKTATDTTTFSTDSVTTAESLWKHVKSAVDTTTFSTDSVTTVESLWKHVKSAVDTTTFSTDSVTTFIFRQPRPADTTTFSVDSVSTVESEWKHFKTIIDTTSFPTDSVTTVESEWKSIRPVADTTTFSTDDVSTIVYRQPRPEESIAFTESVLTALSEWRPFFPLEDTTEFIEDVDIEFGNGCRMLKLDAGTDNEALAISRKSGWVPLGPLDTNPIIRRVSLRYKSADPVNVKIYSNDNTTTPIFNQAFAASSDVVNKKIRVGKRAKYVMLELSTNSSTNSDIAIDHLEVEVDA